MTLEEIFGPDLQKFGIFPGRLDRKYNLPNYINLFETFGTYTPVSWKQVQGGTTGTFVFDDVKYEIQIYSFDYEFDSTVYHCVNIGFVVYKDNIPTTEITPSDHPMQLMSIITNAINAEINNYSVDAFCLVSTNNIAGRTKLYNRIADRYAPKYGTVFKNIIFYL